MNTMNENENLHENSCTIHLTIVNRRCFSFWSSILFIQKKKKNVFDVYLGISLKTNFKDKFLERPNWRWWIEAGKTLRIQDVIRVYP